MSRPHGTNPVLSRLLPLSPENTMSSLRFFPPFLLLRAAVLPAIFLSCSFFSEATPSTASGSPSATTPCSSPCGASSFTYDEGYDEGKSEYDLQNSALHPLGLNECVSCVVSPDRCRAPGAEVPPTHEGRAGLCCVKRSCSGPEDPDSDSPRGSGESESGSSAPVGKTKTSATDGEKACGKTLETSVVEPVQQVVQAAAGSGAGDGTDGRAIPPTAAHADKGAAVGGIAQSSGAPATTGDWDPGTEHPQWFITYLFQQAIWMPLRSLYTILYYLFWPVFFLLRLIFSLMSFIFEPLTNFFLKFFLFNPYVYTMLIGYIVVDRLLSRIFGGKKVSEEQLKKRIDSWPMEGVDFQVLLKEEFGSLILPPGAVRWKLDDPNDVTRAGESSEDGTSPTTGMRGTTSGTEGQRLTRRRSNKKGAKVSSAPEITSSVNDSSEEMELTSTSSPALGAERSGAERTGTVVSAETISKSGSNISLDRSNSSTLKEKLSQHAGTAKERLAGHAAQLRSTIARPRLKTTPKHPIIPYEFVPEFMDDGGELSSSCASSVVGSSLEESMVDHKGEGDHMILEGNSRTFPRRGATQPSFGGFAGGDHYSDSLAERTHSVEPPPNGTGSGPPRSAQNLGKNDRLISRNSDGGSMGNLAVAVDQAPPSSSYAKYVKNMEELSSGEGASTSEVHAAAGTDGALLPGNRRPRSKPSLTPVLCFVNPKAGGQEGYEILNKLGAILHPVQIINLAEQISLYGPIDLLRWFVLTFGASRVKIMVAGGDGTVDWVLGMLDKLDEDEPELFGEASYPPV